MNVIGRGELVMFKFSMCETTLYQYYVNIKFECDCSVSYSYGNTLIGYHICNKNFEHRFILSEGFKRFYENNNSH